MPIDINSLKAPLSFRQKQGIYVGKSLGHVYLCAAVTSHDRRMFRESIGGVGQILYSLNS